ncbi:MAG: hypothetical protein K9N49_07980 [Candidatus Marinimicrobia bacterium]|nr:hypothetical protein [Candidatus Neomarinimicrobiota bacterium]
MTPREEDATPVGAAPELEWLCLQPEPKAWVVAHARPRCEKKILGLCQREGITAYLPLRTTRRRYGKRVRIFQNPLFSGYLFAAVDRNQKQFLRQNDYLANLLETPEQAKLVNQLRQIATVLAIGGVQETLPFIQKGKPVRVIAGPFKGLEGVVERIASQTRIIISVDLIGQGIACEVEPTYLAPT